MDENKVWEKPQISCLDISLTKDVCDPNKLIPGNDGTVDSTNGNAVCGS
ncbi:MAG: hypothetical protein RLZ10_1020 [Bacteroidota bacterium]|jgi:hypothetical protein